MAKATAKKKATKKAAAKKPLKKVNKSAEIRKYNKQHPNEGPTAVANALTKRGIRVVPAQVSTVLSNASGKPKNRRKSGTSTSGKPAGRDAVSFSGLIETRKFVDSVGGVEEAKRLIEALDKLS